MIIKSVDRRVLVGGLILAALPARLLAADPPDRLSFRVFRSGTHVGEHQMTFTRSAGVIAVVTQVAITVRIGPAPFRYNHEARETWRGGRFAELDTTTATPLKRERVSARATGAGVSIETRSRGIVGPVDAAPLTHWNPAAFGGPLFNPQTGKLLKVTARRTTGDAMPDGGAAATRWSVRGDAEIDDWYDEDGVWLGLRGKLEDGSTMIYRRV